MTYCNALKLYASAERRNDRSDERLRILLSCLGSPERRLRLLPVVGEKGKSSIVRMLSSMMAASGVAVASVIYPCLHTPTDNVFVGQRTLTNSEFITHSATLSAAMRRARAEHPALYGSDKPSDDYTRDELLFCLALLSAVGAGAKWLVLEIPRTPFSPRSLVCDSSKMTVITSCGPRIPSDITSMIYRGLTEVVSAWIPHNSAYTAISSACAHAGCRLTIPVFSAVSVQESSLKRTVFTYRGRSYRVPLYGSFAVSNALCALEAAAALRRLGCPITDAGILSGLSTATLPARAEILSVFPTLLCDAACDEFSTEALLGLLRSKGSAIGERITLCVEEGSPPPPILPRLSDAGFSVEETVSVPAGKENRTADLLLKGARHDDLILTVGSLPFVFAMRTEFSKVLCSM